MKSLKIFLNEALTPEQKQVVDNWTPDPVPSQKLSEHVFKGEPVLTYPLGSGDAARPHPDVENHLIKFGYKIPSWDDYRAGYAVDKHDRVVSIGKALNKTKADAELMSKFVNDPNRSSSNSSGLSVAYTWHPHHVAGMSTDRGWTSCMNMVDGGNEHYLEHDIKHGSHVAYLIHSHDKEIENPLSRIAIKPYVSVDGHIALHPTILHTKQYGVKSTPFEDHVSNWTSTHFPMKPNVTYNRHWGLYDEGEQTIKKHSSDSISKGVHSAFNDSPLTSFSDVRHPDDIHAVVTNIISTQEKDVKNPSNIKTDKAYFINGAIGRKNGVYSHTINSVVDAMHSGDVQSTPDLLHTMNFYGSNMSPDHGRKLMDIIISKKQPVDVETSNSTLHNPGITDSQVLDSIKSGVMDIHDTPVKKVTPDIANHFMNNLYQHTMVKLTNSNILRSKHINKQNMSDIFDHVSANGSQYDHSALRNNLKNNPNYSIEDARDFDVRNERRDNKWSAYAMTHKDATENDFDENQNIDSATYRQISSPIISEKLFRSPKHQYSYLKSVYNHTPLPDSPVKATIMAGLGDTPVGYANAKYMLKNANPYLIGSPSQHNETKKNILTTIQSYPKHSPDMEDAISTMADRAVEHDDHDFAHKIMATAKTYVSKPVRFNKSTVDAVGQHGKNVDFVDTKEG